MDDARLAELERRFRETGSEVDCLRWVRALDRAGRWDEPRPASLLADLCRRTDALEEPRTWRPESVWWPSSLRLDFVSQRYWQYEVVNLVLMGEAGSRLTYLLFPRPVARPEPSDHLDGLQGWLWPDDRIVGLEEREAFMESARQWWGFASYRYPDLARRDPGEIRGVLGADLGDLLHRDLRALADRGAGAISEIEAALGLLCALRSFRGTGSQDLEPATVYADAARLPDALRRTVESVSAGSVPSVGIAPAGADGAFEASAIAHKVERADGYAGGYEAFLWRVTLRVAERDWSFHRSLLWSEEREGDPMT